MIIDRKVEIKVVIQGKPKVYLRPNSEVVLLLKQGHSGILFIIPDAECSGLHRVYI